jgi:hypothetical protein
MIDQPLGRLKSVDLRDIWISEAAEFTPWLARPENLEVLGETLGIGLELEAQEKTGRLVSCIPLDDRCQPRVTYPNARGLVGVPDSYECGLNA